MGKIDIDIKEWEQLGWYDLLSRMNLESINWTGMGSWDKMVQLTPFPDNPKVLVIGCGKGKSVLYLAEKHGFDVIGIDIAKKTIEMAQNLAKERKLESKVDFIVADAHDLPFENEMFDIVVTEYMAYFLDMERALKEFKRVLRPGGFIGFNELMLDPNIPEDKHEEIKRVGEMFKEISGYPLRIPTRDEYINWVEQLGFENPKYAIVAEKVNTKDAFAMIGGFKNFFKLMKLTLYLYRHSEIIKAKFKVQKEVKKVTLRKNSTAKYIKPTVFLAELKKE
ncbi:MAG: class I SAM-dependent methyltransferase [Promethearchaeota archaeon]